MKAIYVLAVFLAITGGAGIRAQADPLTRTPVTIVLEEPGAHFDKLEVHPGELLEATAILTVNGTGPEQIAECAGSLAVKGTRQKIDFESCALSRPFGTSRQKVELLLQYRVSNEVVSRSLALDSLQVRLKGENRWRALLDARDAARSPLVTLRSRANPAPLLIRRAWFENAAGSAPDTVAYGERFTLYLEVATAAPVMGGELSVEIQSEKSSRLQTLALPTPKGFAVIHKAGASLLALALRVPKRLREPTRRLAFKTIVLWSEALQEEELPLPAELGINVR